MRSLLLSSTLVAALVATAQGAPVVIDAAKVAAPPRTDPGTGMCMNAVHLGNAVGPYFDVNSAGVMSATMLLDQTFPNGTGMASPPITDVAGQQRYPTINFRNLSPDSVGDFTGPPGNPFADVW